MTSFSPWKWIQSWRRPALEPQNLLRGRVGEEAARRFLQDQGLKFLVANFRGEHGEIDLIFRDCDCLVFVEVKARSREDWVRPASAVNREKQRRLTRTALAYLRRLKSPQVKIRFDVVEVLLNDDQVREVRHLHGAFPMTRPYTYG
jgi:putative endonuclease